MNTYAEALSAYLSRAETGETDLAEAIGKTQASVNRYRNDKRFPDAATAQLIDKHTGGEVSLALWQSAQLEKAGLPQGRAA